jgi:hypothetical protein
MANQLRSLLRQALRFGGARPAPNGRSDTRTQQFDCGDTRSASPLSVECQVIFSSCPAARALLKRAPAFDQHYITSTFRVTFLD